MIVPFGSRTKFYKYKFTVNKKINIGKCMTCDQYKKLISFD